MEVILWQYRTQCMSPARSSDCRHTLVSPLDGVVSGVATIVGLNLTCLAAANLNPSGQLAYGSHIKAYSSSVIAIP